MPTVDIDRDAAREAAERELGKPIYPKQSLTQQLGDWIDELLYRLILKGSTVPGGWFTIAVLVLLVVIAAVVAYRVARKTMRTNRRPEPGLFGRTELGAAEHRAAAERCAAAGDWAGAIRHRLRAVARYLEETSILTAVPGRTATELARDAGAAIPGLSGELRAAATAFNDVTYGEEPGTADAYRLVATLDDDLRTRHTPASPDAETAVPSHGWAEVR